MKKAQANMMVMLGIGVIITVIILGIVFAFIRDNSLNLTTITNETITMTSTSNSVSNETITIASGTGNTGNISLTSVNHFGNSTNNTDQSTLSVGVDVNWTRGGVIVINQDRFSDDDYNISYFWASDMTGNTANDGLSSVTYFGNTTVSTADTDIDVNVEVNFTGAGLITVIATNFSDDNYNISYLYEPSGYLSAGTSRTLVSTIPILLVVLIFLFVAGFLTLRKGQ